MEDKTIEITMVFGTIFVLLLGANAVTQEKQAPASLTPALTAYSAASAGCALCGTYLPVHTSVARAFLRSYFLTSITAQTIAGTAISLTNTTTTNSSTKKYADIGYGLYNLAFVEIARRLPYNNPTRALFLKRYATACLLSQPLMIILKDAVLPSCRQFCEKHLSSETSTGLEETLSTLSWCE